MVGQEGGIGTKAEKYCVMVNESLVQRCNRFLTENIGFMVTLCGRDATRGTETSEHHQKTVLFAISVAAGLCKSLLEDANLGMMTSCDRTYRPSCPPDTTV